MPPLLEGPPLYRRALLLSFAAAGAALFAACEITQVGSYPCPPGMDCSGQPPPPNTGRGETGGPCQSSAECGGSSCITDPFLSALGVDVSRIDVPNGMCSQIYCTSDAQCGDGGVCANGAAFNSPMTTLCLRSCTNLTSCRWKEGYSCFVQNPATNPEGVCLPDSVIAVYYCPSGCP